MQAQRLRLDERARRKEEFRGVVRMCVPIVITICSRMVMDLADFKMVSYLGQAAQGAILPAQVVVWTFIVLGFSTVSVVNTFVAQCLGRGRPGDTGAYAWQGIYLGFVFALGGLILRPFLPALFALLGHAPDVQALELAYAEVTILSVGPTIGAEALASFFNGIHRPKVPMWTALSSNVINIVASLPLIFGWWFFPKLGIAGAAWGTLIAVTYRFSRMLWIFLSPAYDAEFRTREGWRPDLSRFGAILRVGMPQGLQSFSDVFVWGVFITILVGRKFGGADLVATNIAWQFMRIAFMPGFGMGIALASLVGKAIGQQDNERALRETRLTAGIMLAYMTGLALVYLFFRQSLIGWWMSEPDDEVVRIGSAIMVCAVIFQVFDGLGIIYQFALRGAGDTFWPALVSCAAHWTFVVGGGFLATTLRPQWRSLGPWCAATALLVFLGMFLWWRWRSRAWEKIDIFRHERGRAGAPSSAPSASGDVPPGEIALDLGFEPAGPR